MMLKKVAVFQIILSIFCTYLHANQTNHFLDQRFALNLFTASQYERDAQLTSIAEKVEDRWRVFKNGRVFEPFRLGKSDTVLKEGKKIYLIYDISSLHDIESSGYKLNPVYSSRDYEITKLDLKFLNPAKRDAQCTKMVLAEISH